MSLLSHMSTGTNLEYHISLIKHNSGLTEFTSICNTDLYCFIISSFLLRHFVRYDWDVEYFELILSLNLFTLGVVIDSNAPCYNSTVLSGSLFGRAVGSSCIGDNNCLYNKCVNKICVAPTLPCPSNSTGNHLNLYQRL